MDSFQFDYEHYVIVQKIPHLKTLKNYIGKNVNNTHMKKLVNSMVGNVEIFLYNPKNNSRKDFTSQFYNRTFNIKTVKIEKIVLATVCYTCTEWGPDPEYFKFYYEQKGKYFPPEKLFIQGYVYKLKDKKITYQTSSEGLFSSSIEKHLRKSTSGNEYEKFIASKYESQNYQVELNGIKKGFNDGGLDLIAFKNNKIVLVQCKNWALSNNYKINQKDLRAFIGDCYLYLKDINIKDKKISFHFIVSHNDILTKSAQIFLDENSFLKFKVIAFEK